jgi:hypothetical protein
MYGNPEIWNYGITENWIFGLFSIPEDARTRFLIKEICTEIRNYGITENRVFRSVLNPRSRKNPFPEPERGFDNTRNRMTSHPGLLPDVAFLTRTIDLINNKTLEKKTIRANSSLASQLKN